MPFALTGLLGFFNFKWYEWILIGSLIVLSLLTWTQYSKLKSTEQELTTIKINIEALIDQKDFLIYTRDLDEWSYTQLDGTKSLFQQEQERFHLDFHNEYQELIRDTPPLDDALDTLCDCDGLIKIPIVDKKVPEHVPTTTDTQTPTVVKQPHVPIVDPVNDRARVSLLAQRLQQSHYCSTAPTALHCSASTST